MSDTRICVFCHTPHGASSQSTLWNRKDPIGPYGNGTFPLYANGTGTSHILDPDVQAAAQYYSDGTGGVVYPSGASRLCLSCHDGVSAIGEVINSGDGLGNIAMQAGYETIQAYRGVGYRTIIDLATSHPISFVYDGTVAGLLSDGRKGPGETYAWPMVNPSVTPLDSQSRMQCTTCHDPHNDTLLSGDAGLPMWRHITGNSTTEYDEVCQNCHEGTDYTGHKGNEHTL